MKVPQIKLPGTVLIAGPTRSGKTSLVVDILKKADWLIIPSPKEIYWHYGIEQHDLLSQLKNVSIPITFQKGMPNFDAMSLDVQKPKVLVLDDLISEAD